MSTPTTLTLKRVCEACGAPLDNSNKGTTCRRYPRCKPVVTVPQAPIPGFPVERLKEEICKFYRIPLPEFEGKTRQGEKPKARRLFVYLLYRDYRLSRKCLRKEFGIDHSSLDSSLDNVLERVEAEAHLYLEDIEKIRTLLTSAAN